MYLYPAILRIVKLLMLWILKDLILGFPQQFLAHLTAVLKAVYQLVQ